MYQMYLEYVLHVSKIYSYSRVFVFDRLDMDAEDVLKVQNFMYPVMLDITKLSS